MRVGFRTSIVGLFLAGGLLSSVVSCSSSAPSSSASSSPGATASTTGTGDTVPAAGDSGPQGAYATALAARLGPDGSIDLPLALALFDASYGTTLGSGPAFPGGSSSGTLAVMAISEHWSELSAAQQAVVNAAMAADAASTVALTDSSPAAGAALVARRPRRNDTLDTMARHAIAQIASHWIGTTTFHPSLALMPHDLPPTPSGGRVLADAHPTQADGSWSYTPSTYDTCIIRVFPALLDPARQATDVVAAITHEIFHCFQFTVADSGGQSIATHYTPWVVEGQAEWVGASIAGGGAVATDWWRVWMLQPAALFDRSYDTIGFYASLARRDIDPWQIFQPMLRGSLLGFDQAYAAATPGRGVGFLGEVAIDHAGLPNVGAPWEPLGPGAPTTITAALPLPIATGASHDYAATIAVYDTTRFAADVVDPVVTFTSDTGPWVVGSPGKAHVVPTSGVVTVCLSEACVCPDGRTLDIPTLGVASTVAVGVANGGRAVVTAHVTIQSRTLDDACAALPHLPVSVMSCLVGTWRLTLQQFADDIAPGVAGAGLTGGIGGRFLTINADGTYHMTGDGSDPIIGHAVLSGGLNTDIRVVISGTVNGKVQASGDHAVFTSTDASIDLHAEETISGVPPIAFDHHYTDPSLFGNGDATVICTPNSMSLAFTNVKFAYSK